MIKFKEKIKKRKKILKKIEYIIRRRNSILSLMKTTIEVREREIMKNKQEDLELEKIAQSDPQLIEILKVSNEDFLVQTEVLRKERQLWVIEIKRIKDGFSL